MLKPALLAVLYFLVAVQAFGSTLKSGVFDPPRAAPVFSLLASQGGTFDLGGVRDKLVILAFGFTHCPDICPMTLANLAQVSKNLGEEAEQVQVVFITVDPERDNVERLQHYMAHFNTGFIGLTGTPEQLTEVRRAYGIIAAKEVHGDGNYQVHHSSYLYLIDRQGLLRALVPFGTAADDIVHDLRILLREVAEPAML